MKFEMDAAGHTVGARAGWEMTERETEEEVKDKLGCDGFVSVASTYNTSQSGRRS